MKNLLHDNDGMIYDMIHATVCAMICYGGEIIYHILFEITSFCRENSVSNNFVGI